MGFSENRLWTVGGGKGGVGKTFMTACLGIAMARSGKSVILADANLAAPDLHGFLGAKPSRITLREVASGGAALSEALLATPEPHLHLLNCTGDEFGMADLDAGERRRVAECLLQLDADCVLIDVGTGTSTSVLDFFNLARQSIVISSPDPASMRCTYRFMRNAIFRRVQEKFGAEEEVIKAIRRMHVVAGAANPLRMADFLAILNSSAPETARGIDELVQAWRPNLVVNLADSEQDQRIGEIVQSGVRKFLRVDLNFCGLVPFDPAARRNAPRSLDFSAETTGMAARQIRELAQRLGGMEAEGSNKRAAPTAAPAMGLNHNLELLGRNVHIQTEDQGSLAHSILTQVFCEGRVLLSTKSSYSPALREAGKSEQLLDLMRSQHFNIIRQLEVRNTGTQISPA